MLYVLKEGPNGLGEELWTFWKEIDIWCFTLTMEALILSSAESKLTLH